MTTAVGGKLGFKGLEELRLRGQAKMLMRRGQPPAGALRAAGVLPRLCIMVCGDTGCLARKSDKTRAALEQAMAAHGLESEIQVVRSGCFGFCAQAPVVVPSPRASSTAR
ncbi:MAG: (2Fe-2S) ferredoxin domain-containing protein [Firmicutes bacterium]|nr:(2Fe-2S) ferredoxin domain-containing protein [Bacillota bacterium]